MAGLEDAAEAQIAVLPHLAADVRRVGLDPCIPCGMEVCC